MKHLIAVVIAVLVLWRSAGWYFADAEAKSGTTEFIVSSCPCEGIEDQVTEALEKAQLHIKSSEGGSWVTLEYRSPADQLRLEADRIEQRDRDIEFIRETYERWLKCLEHRKGTQ